MTKKLFINVIFFAVCFLLQGCYTYEDQKQLDWHQEIFSGYSAVLAMQSRAPLMVDRQLAALIGEPDFELSPFELQELLVEDESYRKKVMNEVWSDYCQHKRKLGKLHYVPGQDKWKECEEFRKCSLWLYDESKHFTKTLDKNCWHRWFCAPSGFTCYFFFVEDSNVIDATSVIFWKPLHSLPRE